MILNLSSKLKVWKRFKRRGVYSFKWVVGLSSAWCRASEERAAFLRVMKNTLWNSPVEYFHLGYCLCFFKKFTPGLHLAVSMCKKGRSTCYDFDEGRILFLCRKTDLIYYFIREVNQIELKLANWQKPVKRMILEHALYPILYLWKDHSLKLVEIWDIKVFMAIHVVYTLTWWNHVILFYATTESFPPSFKPMRRWESKWKLSLFPKGFWKNFVFNSWKAFYHLSWYDFLF